MIDIIRSEHLARELLEKIVLLIRGVVRPDNPKLAAAVAHFLEFLPDDFERLGPGRRLELAVLAYQRSLDSLGVVREIEGVAALDAEELAVAAGAVAVVAADDFVVANAERRLTAVRAVRADGPNVLHLPGASS